MFHILLRRDVDNFTGKRLLIDNIVLLIDNFIKRYHTDTILYHIMYII